MTFHHHLRPATASLVTLRHLSFRDYEAVADIEANTFASPISRDHIEDALRERDVHGMVAEVAGHVVGYTIFALKSDRITVIRFVVHPGMTRRGVGRDMATRLVGKLGGRRTVAEVLLEDTNTTGHIFLRAMGWKATGVKRGHFEGGREDGYLFRFSL